MHPVARFTHSLKRLFTTCRVFSSSFTGKISGWRNQAQTVSSVSGARVSLLRVAKGRAFQKTRTGTAAPHFRPTGDAAEPAAASLSKDSRSRSPRSRPERGNKQNRSSLSSTLTQTVREPPWKPGLEVLGNCLLYGPD